MRSTVGQLEEFKESVIWLDMLGELDVWLTQIHEQLEDPDGSMTDKELHRLGGNAQSVRNFRGIVDVLINLALEEVEDGQRG